MELRRLNSAGMDVFQAFLDSLTSDSPRPYPAAALDDPVYSESLDRDTEIEPRTFLTRFELAEYLDRKFDAAGHRPSSSDAGLWAWLALFYFHEICPKGPKSELRPGAAARWIPQSSDWRRYYRHLVAGPYSIYRAHRDDPQRALALLCQKPGRPGDLVEQLASRQEIVTNPALLTFATHWFVDPQTGQQRRFANSKGPGGARRFAAVLAQFDVTWDLSMLSAESLRLMMPPEFSASGRT